MLLRSETFKRVRFRNTLSKEESQAFFRVRKGVSETNMINGVDLSFAGADGPRASPWEDPWLEVKKNVL